VFVLSRHTFFIGNIDNSTTANKPVVVFVNHFLRSERRKQYARFPGGNFRACCSLKTFKDTEEAIKIANDTIYGLGAGVWTRDAHEMYQVPRAIQAGRVWVNQSHTYPAHAPFGGYKQSGFGR